MLDGRCKSGGFPLNLAHLSSLKSLRVDYELYIEQLPTPLVKLVLPAITHHQYSYLSEVADLSYLKSRRELDALSESYRRVLS
ncbi:hypothetical protein P9112_001803 [Eukaryota sp. TZLM1-RC]